MPQSNEDWTLEIYPKTKLLDLNLKEIWRYRDLLTLFVRRDFVAVFHHALPGRFWCCERPYLAYVMSMSVVGRIAKWSPAGVPWGLFYWAGIVPCYISPG